MLFSSDNQLFEMFFVKIFKLLFKRVIYWFFEKKYNDFKAFY